MPLCDLPNRLGQGVHNGGRAAVAEALDGEVVGLAESSVEFQSPMTMRFFGRCDRTR